MISLAYSPIFFPKTCSQSVNVCILFLHFQYSHIQLLSRKGINIPPLKSFASTLGGGLFIGKNMASGKNNYFRHSCAARNDQKIVQITDKFGMAGYAYFFIIIELCAEQAEKGRPLVFYFHQRTLCSSLGVRPQKLRNYLVEATRLRMFHAKTTESLIEVSIPNLSKYLGWYDNYTSPKSPNKERNKETNRESSEKLEISPDQIDEVLNYFNSACGKRCELTTETYRKLIGDRLKRYSVDDCKRVVDIKYNEWKNNQKMKRFIRPLTLFNKSKFEEYVNQEPVLSIEQELKGIFNKALENDKN